MNTDHQQSYSIPHLAFAPMEGITTAALRRVHQEIFGGADSYYAPFVNTGRGFLKKTRDRRDLDPENNQGIPLIPQLLSNNSRDFLAAVEKLAAMGYEEINLNLGCPSPTVVSHHRGAGFLEDPQQLDLFFDEVYKGLPDISERIGRQIRISVKTRLGLRFPEEAADLMKVFNRYPLSTLILHPRLQCEGYRGNIHLDLFLDLYRESKIPVIYNGDLLRPEDAGKILDVCSHTDATLPLGGLMIGRGAIQNPAIFREIRGGSSCSREELRHYLQQILRYTADGIPEKNNQLMKMKDLWTFLGAAFPEGKKHLKAIRRADSLEDYQEAVRELLDS